MSKRSALFLHVSLGRSRYLLLLNLIIHGLAFIASVANALPWWSRVLIFASVLASLYFSSKRYGLFGGISRIEIRFVEHRGWSLRIDENDFFSVVLLPSSVIIPWITILHFKTDRKVIPVVVFRDSLERDDFRRLRVFAKIVGR